MADPQKAVDTQLANIEKRSGKSLAELRDALAASGLAKHGELLAYAKEAFEMGHGDANALVKHHLQALSPLPEGDGAVLDALYAGPKAELRPIHDALIAAVERWGEYEVAPKKGYVSLRRKKQFAMVGPATSTRVEVGLNVKGIPGTERLVEQPAGGMCQYKVKLTAVDQVDDELLGWLRAAFESAV